MKKYILPTAAFIIFFLSCNTTPERTKSAADDSPAMNDSAQETGREATLKDMRSPEEIMKKMMDDMRAMPMTGDADHDFALLMKRHHDGAIEMAEMELNHGKNEDLKQLAQKIIDDSRTDNETLQAFLQRHEPVSQSPFSRKAINKMDVSASGTASSGNDMDKQFAATMIKHHQDGADMSKLYLESNAQEGEMKKIANRVIKASAEDIKQMKSWQNRNP